MNNQTILQLIHFVSLLAVVASSPFGVGAPNPISIGVRSALTATNGFGLFSPSPSRAATRVAVRSRRSNIGGANSSPFARRSSRASQFVRVPSVEDEESNEVTLCGRTSSSVSASAKIDAIAPGGAATAAMAVARRLHFWENMVCGAVSRSIAQTVMHPANTMKTILQSQRGVPASERMTIAALAKPSNVKLLTRGAGAQFILSVPHGAVNFAVLEFVRLQMTRVTDQEWVRNRINVEAFSAGFDILSSAISTVCCSVVSTPQMMITDNIMAGTYPNLPAAVKGLASEKGVKGFYAGWWPGLAGKIPSYALTWTLFQQLKLAHRRTFQRDPKDIENSIMGCMASATTVTIMIPLDTIKTRLVTQLNYPDLVPYKGIIDCGRRIFQEEGMIAFYRGLSPRLISVVPMIGIQFGVYEAMKKAMLMRGMEEEKPAISGRKLKQAQESAQIRERETRKRDMEEIAMEVAADDDQPFPAPRLNKKRFGLKKKD